MHTIRDIANTSIQTFTCTCWLFLIIVTSSFIRHHLYIIIYVSRKVAHTLHNGLGRWLNANWNGEDVVAILHITYTLSHIGMQSVTVMYKYLHYFSPLTILGEWGVGVGEGKRKTERKIIFHVWLQKTYDALMSVSQLKSVWISKASALQRKGR